MKVLMVGATGSNAGLILLEVKKRGVAVRALVREEGKNDLARRAGADETAVGDLRDPANLRAAVEDVDGVFHINPAFAPDEARMGVAMVEAAKDAGVRKFVFSGVYHPSISKMVNHAAKQPVEEALYESGLDFTILQPAMFMQNLDGAWNAVLRSGRLTTPYSMRAKVSYVDYRDVAEVAALAMTGDELGYGTFELAAPGMVDRGEMAEMAGAALGRTVEAGELSPGDWASSSGMPERPLRDGLVRMMKHYDEHGFPGGNALVLRAILGREPGTLQEYFRKLADRPARLAEVVR